jgi:hypothetical protein
MTLAFLIMVHSLLQVLARNEMLDKLINTWLLHVLFIQHLKASAWFITIIWWRTCCLHKNFRMCVENSSSSSKRSLNGMTTERRCGPQDGSAHSGLVNASSLWPTWSSERTTERGWYPDVSGSGVITKYSVPIMTIVANIIRHSFSLRRVEQMRLAMYFACQSTPARAS